MANDLHLGLQPGGNDLHLGYAAGDDREAVIAANTGGARAVAVALSVVGCDIYARTGGARAHIVLAYDPNMLSGVVGATSERWSSGTAIRQGAASGYQQAVLVTHGRFGGWRESSSVHGGGIESWRTSERFTGGSVASWREGALEHGLGEILWYGAPLEVGAGLDAWREGAPLRESTEDEWMRGLPRPTHGAQPSWTDGECVEHPALDGFRGAQWLPMSCDENSWNDGAWVGYVRRIPIPWVPPPKPWVPYGNNLHLCRFDGGNDLHLGYQCRRYIPRRRSYYVNHQIEILRLSDGLPIACSTITISLDADSWAWNWSATLIGTNALSLVIPSELGEPVTLSATINGNTWHLIVEAWQETRAFGSRSIKISGRGLSAWLGQPYEQPVSGTLENARYLREAMENLLPLGGDWILDWVDGTPDWYLPSGSWNWNNKAPIQIIHEAAQAVGLVVVPGMASKTLTIQPRYPVLPWNYAEVEVNNLLSIPDSAILNLSRKRTVPTQANAVYVHGGDAGGIIARVWRSGTAGDRLATTTNAEQITHVYGARLLGERLLAAQAEQASVRSVTLPLGGVFLLAHLGEVVALDLEGEDVRGVVNGISITAEGGTVRQTISLGEDTPNAWAMWRRLTPDAPLLLGNVLSLHEDGTYTVEMIGGGRQRVRGEAVFGDNVWVRSGYIEGKAPSLLSYDIEV